MVTRMCISRETTTTFIALSLYAALLPMLTFVCACGRHLANQLEEHGGFMSKLPCWPKKKAMTEEEKIEAHKLGNLPLSSEPVLSCMHGR